MCTAVTDFETFCDLSCILTAAVVEWHSSPPQKKMLARLQFFEFWYDAEWMSPCIPYTRYTGVWYKWRHPFGVKSKLASSLSSSKTVSALAPNTRDNQPSVMGDTRFCCTRPVTLNDPDMNPVDYRILGDIQQRLYQTKGHDTDELKQRICYV